MAIFLNRPVGDLLVRGRTALGMTQRKFGEALGASHRTAERWDAGRSRPSVEQVITLAKLVFPHDRALAASLAEAASETLLSLGLVAPPPPVIPPIPRHLLIDAIVSSTAEALRTYPSAARAGLAACFAKARETGVGLDELATALSSASDESSSIPR